MLRSLSFSKRRARRPTGAARLSEKDELNFDGENQGLGQFDSPSGPSDPKSRSSLTGALGRSLTFTRHREPQVTKEELRFENHMIELDCIWSKLHVLIRSEHGVGTPEFAKLVTRLENSQQEHASIVATGWKISIDDQRRVVEKTAKVLRLFKKLTDNPEEAKLELPGMRIKMAGERQCFGSSSSSSGPAPYVGTASFEANLSPSGAAELAAARSSSRNAAAVERARSANVDGKISGEGGAVDGSAAIERLYLSMDSGPAPPLQSLATHQPPAAPPHTGASNPFLGSPPPPPAPPQPQQAAASSPNLIDFTAI